jgi:hypothetical protein
LTGHLKLVPLGHLTGDGLGRIIEFLENIPFCYLIVADLILKVAAERFNHGENYFPPAYIYRDPVDEVKITVGLAVLLAVEIIKAKYLKQNGVGYPSFRQIIDGIPRFVIFIKDIKLKITAFEPA